MRLFHHPSQDEVEYRYLGNAKIPPSQQGNARCHGIQHSQPALNLHKIVKKKYVSMRCSQIVRKNNANYLCSLTINSIFTEKREIVYLPVLCNRVGITK